MVKPSDKEIRAFRKYLKKQGFTVDGLCSDVYFLYMKYGYICLSIEYTKKGEFKEVSAFLSLGWENSKCSRFYFPNYYKLGKAIKKVDCSYVDRAIRCSNIVMNQIGELMENIPKAIGMMG